MKFYKVFYFEFFDKDVSIIINCNSNNIPEFSFKKEGREIIFDFYKLHISMTVYKREKINK